MQWKFNQKQLKTILDSLVICVDTRENANSHITNFFDKKKIPYCVEKLPFGDYSCKIPKGTLNMFTTDIYFTNDFVIERKNSIDELAGNLKEDAARLKKELAHLNMYQIRYLVYVEDPNFEENLRNGKFRSMYDPYTLMRRLYCLECEYNTAFIGLSKEVMGSKIANKMQTWVHTLFKHKGFILESEEENE